MKLYKYIICIFFVLSLVGCNGCSKSARTLNNNAENPRGRKKRNTNPVVTIDTTKQRRNNNTNIT